MIMTRLNADVLTTRVADGIAVITLGSAKRIYMERAEGVKRAINSAPGHALNLTHWRPREGHASNSEIYTVPYRLSHFKKLSHADTVDYELIGGTLTSARLQQD